MTLRTTILTLAALTLGAVGQAATYHVTLLRPSFVGGQELKPGDYTIEVNNDTAVISHGKQSFEAKVKSQSADKKHNTTTIRYAVDGDKYKVQSIEIGGSRTNLVINDSGAKPGF